MEDNNNNNNKEHELLSVDSDSNSFFWGGESEDGEPFLDEFVFSDLDEFDQSYFNDYELNNKNKEKSLDVNNNDNLNSGDNNDNEEDDDNVMDKINISNSTIENNNNNDDDEEMKLVREELRMIKLKQKQDRATRRQNLRKEKMMESLIVPQDDTRRKALQIIFDCFHTSDFKKLKSFLIDHAFDHLLFRFQSENATPDVNGQIILPNNLEIRGIDAFVGFTAAIANVKPDQIYIISDTTIRNTQRSCSLTSNFTMMGTCVYELLLTKKKVKDEETNKVRRSISNNDVTNTNTINLTELCGKVESLSISQLDENEEITFDRGSRLEKFHPNKGTGQAIVHFLNKEMKIHLIEYKIHFEETPVNDPSTNNNNPNETNNSK